MLLRLWTASLSIAQHVLLARRDILTANAEDVARAREAGTSEALVDRLALNDQRIDALAESVRAIAAQPDPVGEVLGMLRRPSGILVGQVRVPLGVVAMIYEARPNVTVDAAALAWKAGNAVILRGGSDAQASNRALGAAVLQALAAEDLPIDAVQIVPPLSREETKVLLAQTGLVDLVIPRGGAGLIRFVTEHARVPVIQHFEGICHVFLDEDAEKEPALRIVEDGKARKPGACNATECVLVHEAAAPRLLPDLVARLGAASGEGRGCERTKALGPRGVAARPEDFGKEFLDRVIAIRVVPSMDEAIAHIARFGSGHTEAIVTRSYANGQRFLREIDAKLRARQRLHAFQRWRRAGARRRDRHQHLQAPRLRPHDSPYDGQVDRGGSAESRRPAGAAARTPAISRQLARHCKYLAAPGSAG